MKNINFKLLFLGLIAFVLFLTGCQVDTTYTVNGFELVGEVYVQNIDIDTETVSLDNVVQYNTKQANIKFYYDEECSMEITEELSLLEGDNYVYCRIAYKNIKLVQLVILNFHRLKMCVVKFSTGCNVKIDNLEVLEGTKISKPEVELTKSGYAFEGWSFNFNKAVTDDLVIEAKWKANSYTITYDANGGEIEFGNTIVTYGEKYELFND